MRGVRALFLFLAIGLLACGDDQGVGKVVGFLHVPVCDEGAPLDVTCMPEVPPEDCNAFDLRADFFALEPYGNSALLRIQRGGRILALTDALVLEIRDYRLLRGNLGRPLPVGPDQNVRAALGLFHLCPDSTQPYAIHGIVRFEAFGVSQGEQVTGIIDRLEVRDGRAQGGAAQLLGILHGDFDFTVRKGPPYQPFAD